jgi:excisionase family DNA binding protein
MKQDGENKIGTEWLGLRQVTQYANISERTVRAWIHAPVEPLPAVRVGGKILVRRSELDSWLEKHRMKTLETVDLDAIVRDVLHEVVHGR